MREAKASSSTEPSPHQGASPSAPTAPALPKGVTPNAISAAKIEVIVARAVGIFGVVFGLQSVPIMYGQLPDLDPVWADAVNIGVFGGLLLVAIATAFNRFVRLTTSWVAFAYVMALLLWPATVIDASIFADQKPWLWFLCTVATACAAVAFSVVWAAIYTIIVPVIYGALRTLPSGGHVDGALAALDTAYAIILGLVVLIIITLLRQAAAAVDVAQTTALATYSTAVRQHATEVERIEVDAIVHDSVLTTFISAANARTPADEELAASMARDAISRLDAAGAVLPGDDRTVPVAQLERRLRAAVVAYATPVSVASYGIAGLLLPVQTVEAIYSAAVQALVNSLQHADGYGTEAAAHRPVQRSLRIEGNALGGVRVEVLDTGIGFVESRATTGRIGLRVSIIERMAAVGGVAHVHSEPGAGATIVIEWPGEDRTFEKPELDGSVFDASAPSAPLETNASGSAAVAVEAATAEPASPPSASESDERSIADTNDQKEATE